MMKNTKYLWVLFCGFFPVLLSAQLEKGNTTLNGSAGINYFFENSADLFQLGITPVKTWMIGDGLELGLDVGGTLLAGDGGEVVVYQLIPQFNYYFNPSATGLRFFAGAELGITGLSGDGFDEQTDLILGFGFGALQFLNPNVSTQFRLGYRYIDSDFADASSITFLANLKAFMDSPSRSEEDSASPNLGKGTLLIGGSTAQIDFTNQSFGDQDFDETTVQIRPNVIYLVTDQLGVGGSFELLISNGDLTADLTSISLIPEFRYYFKPIDPTKGGNFFANVISGIQRVDIGNFEDTRGVLSLGVGSNWMIGQNVAIEGILSYGRQDVGFDGLSIENRIGANFFIQYFWNR